MTNKDFLYLSGACLTLIVLYMAYREANTPAAPTQLNTAQQTGSLPVAWNSPMDGVYAANPSAYQPASQASLTLNVNNPFASELSDQYIPMFGFVGVAQGEMYQ